MVLSDVYFDKLVTEEASGDINTIQLPPETRTSLTCEVFQCAGVCPIREGVPLKGGVAKVEDGRQQLKDAAGFVREEANHLHSFLWVWRRGQVFIILTLYQPMTHICVMSSHMNLYGGFNTLYRLFCFFKLFLMVGTVMQSVRRILSTLLCVRLTRRGTED